MHQARKLVWWQGNCPGNRKTHELHMGEEFTLPSAVIAPHWWEIVAVAVSDMRHQHKESSQHLGVPSRHLQGGVVGVPFV
eukprot:g32261.t1